MNSINQIMKTLSQPEQLAFLKLIINYSKDEENLIIFFVPGADWIGGGVLSIFSLYEESKKLSYIHGCKILICTLPKDAILLKYTRFKNNVPIYPFQLIPKHFSKLRKCILHIPEIFIGVFKDHMSNYINYLSAIPDLQINILNQNIELMPDVHAINQLKKFTPNVTCTTAHERYTTRELREAIGIPLHKFSTYISPEQYKFLDYTHKENLMVVSMDNHPLKSTILDLIKRCFPAMNIIIIQDLNYEDYKELISRAKWAITFGEGLDGYFIETVFSGGISFAAYNDKFFTSEFINLKTVYLNYEQLVNNICEDLKNLDNEQNFKQYQNEQLSILKKYYNYNKYVKNVERFYKKHYTFR